MRFFSPARNSRRRRVDCAQWGVSDGGSPARRHAEWAPAGRRRAINEWPAERPTVVPPSQTRESLRRARARAHRALTRPGGRCRRRCRVGGATERAGAARARREGEGGVSWVCRSTERLCPSPLPTRAVPAARGKRSRRGGDAEPAHGGGGRGGGTGARLGPAVKSAVRRPGAGPTLVGASCVGRCGCAAEGYYCDTYCVRHQGLLP